MYFGLLLVLKQVGVAESEKRVAAIFLLPVWALEPLETLLSAVFWLVRLPCGRETAESVAPSSTPTTLSVKEYPT